MTAQIPLDVSMCDLTSVFLARQSNDINKLKSVFDSMPFILNPPIEVDIFFCQYSNYSTTYDVENIKEIVQQIELPFLFASNALPISLANSLPLNSELPLKNVLEKGLNDCFNLLFTNNGELQSWLSDLFEAGQLQELFNQFGKASVKFELFYWWSLKYCKVFNPPVDIPSDEDCSSTLNLIFQHELDCYRKVLNAFAELEQLLQQIEDSYKLKKEVVDIANKIELGIFTNHLFFQPQILEIISAFTNIIKEPHQISHIQKLQHHYQHLNQQPTYTIYFDLLVAISSFCAAFFLVGGLAALFSTTNLPLAMIAIAVSAVFCGCGVITFQQARPTTLLSLLEDFSEKAQEFTEQYSTTINL